MIKHARIHTSRTLSLPFSHPPVIPYHDTLPFHIPPSSLSRYASFDPVPNGGGFWRAASNFSARLNRSGTTFCVRVSKDQDRNLSRQTSIMLIEDVVSGPLTPLALPRNSFSNRNRFDAEGFWGPLFLYLSKRRSRAETKRDHNANIAP